jgi:gas vesicle protein
MTVAERLAPVARTIADARLGRRLRRGVPAIGNNAAEAVDQVVDAIAKVAEDLARNAEQAGEEAKKESRHVARDIGEAVSDAFEAVTTAAGDAASKAGDAARDLHLDDRVEDVVKRIRSEFPTERITTLVTNLERELPTTDKDRYDRAFQRGRTRARTSFVVVGLGAGIAAGIAGAFLLDPQRGQQRRAAIKSKAKDLGTTVTRQARGTATWTVDRARGIAIERGIVKPDADAGAIEDVAKDALAPLVPVMDSFEDAVSAIDVPALDDTVNPDAIAQLADDGAPVPTNPGS